MADGVAAFSASVAGVTLDGINHAVFHPCDDAYMIGLTILGTRFSVRRIPVEEDNHTGNRSCRSVGPLSSLLEPFHTPNAACELGDNTSIDVPTFIGTPRNKAGAPCHSFVEAIPTPIRLTAHIAKLGLRNSHDLLIRRMDTQSVISCSALHRLRCCRRSGANRPSAGRRTRCSPYERRTR